MTERNETSSARRRRNRSQPDRQPPGLSRRDFLKLAVAGAAGAAIGFVAAPKLTNVIEEAGFQHDLDIYRRQIDILVPNLDEARRQTFMNEGWFEPVPLNLPENYSQLSPDQQLAARLTAAGDILNRAATMMLNSVSPHFRAAAEALKNTVVPENQPIGQDGSLKLYVDPFPPKQTSAGAIFSTSFRADLSTGKWFTEFRANRERFSPTSPLAVDPRFSSWLFLGAGLFHDLEHVRLAVHMSRFFREQGLELADIIDKLEHDPWQEPFAHWMVAVWADSTLARNDSRVKDMIGSGDAITTDVIEYRRFRQRGISWDSDQWRQFITSHYLVSTARYSNSPMGIAWIPPLSGPTADRHSIALNLRSTGMI